MCRSYRISEEDVVLNGGQCWSVLRDVSFLPWRLHSFEVSHTVTHFLLSRNTSRLSQHIFSSLLPSSLLSLFSSLPLLFSPSSLLITSASSQIQFRHITWAALQALRHGRQRPVLHRWWREILRIRPYRTIQIQTNRANYTGSRYCWAGARHTPFKKRVEGNFCWSEERGEATHSIAGQEDYWILNMEF